MSEQWRDIPGYAGRYQASDEGRVRTVLDSGETRVRILRRDARGYERVNLITPEGDTKTESVHTLVLAAFTGLRGNRLTHANHKDGMKSNNRLANLEWVTASENAKHAYAALGRNPVRNGCAKVRLEKQGRATEYDSMRAAADALGVDYTAVSKAARKGHKCKGHRVSYA